LKILGIETSSPLFSLCINEDEKMMYEIRKSRQIDISSRDAQFFIEAKRLIEYFGRDKIGALAVSIGPGMFTSLRVGLSLAKGLALALNIPIVAVNTLDVIGVSMSFLHYPVLAVINAYHEEIYAALYKKGERETDYLLTTPEQVENIIKGETMVIGSGIEVFKKYHLSHNSKVLHFLDDDAERNYNKTNAH
jgi:tRNA threonylcarbamoyl adenosine modification protein YeaZ